MISSKPSERGVLDHDILIDVQGRVFVAIGNMHPPNGVIAYLKYVPSPTPTIWRRKGTWLRRVLKSYGVKNIFKVAEYLPKITYDPILGVSVPFIPWGSVKEWLKPEERLQELMRRAENLFEVKAVEAAMRISNSTGVSITSLGVTGSFLLGAQNPKYSDLNLVIYGCKEALDVAYSKELGLDPIPRERYAERIRKQSLTYSLPESVLRELNPPYKYGAIGSTLVGLSFVSKRRVRYGSVTYRSAGIVKAKLYVEGGSCSSLQYPSIARVDEVIDIEGSRSGYQIKAVLSYEGIFNWALFRGGCVRVKGIEVVRSPCGDALILVGGREEPGYVIPCRTS